MENARQQAFLRLRPPCVELSGVALQFRGKQTSVKNVLHALLELHTVLRDLGRDDALDPKLAEYAFFPLSHVFNEAQRLSSRCLEIAVQTLQILVSTGWRQHLGPEMCKQLLILMTLLAGGSPSPQPAEPPSDDLKAAAFQCIELLVEWSSSADAQKSALEVDGTKHIVDQITYLLLEAIADNPSDHVQLAAAKALSRLNETLKSRVLLASLLPRTVSALTKALRASTEIRRSPRVLATDLNVLTQILRRVLRDSVVYPSCDSAANANSEGDVLNESWLRATASQVKIALTNIAKLRSHHGWDVKEALLELCLMVVEECPRSLAESASTMVETIVALAGDQNSTSASSALTHLATVNPSISDMLKSSLYSWSMSLPRLMQGSDDQPKQRALTQISTAFEVLASSMSNTDILATSIASTLIDSVSTTIQISKLKSITAIAEVPSLSALTLTAQGATNTGVFQPILLDHKSQAGSLAALQGLLINLQTFDSSNNIAREVVDRIPNATANDQLSSMWLALNLLRRNKSDFTIEDMIEDPSTSPILRNSRPFLVSDLYSSALPILLENVDVLNDTDVNWQSSALALECLVVQAEQLGPSYRPELIDTLYPVLSLLGSSNQNLQVHAMTALNLLATACEYSSAKDLLVENVDYLVNSVAIKLNSFDLSPQAPQVLLMMIRLCGASLIPYLDDLIGSIFAALDTFHGYPKLVEMLFEVLRAIVDESAKRPQLAIADGTTPDHRKAPHRPSTVDDVLSDLGDIKGRKRKHESAEEDQSVPAPHRPWLSSTDTPGTQREAATSEDEPAENDEDSALPTASNDVQQEKALSKPHQLLLSISQATTPHLSSPSPRVRLTLLQLLDRIAPLLAQDENSFLPLINSVWPSLVAKLFGEVGVDGEGEAAYNVCAAAETMAKLCEGAGDFMASRIEDIFSQLARLYKQVWSRIQTDRERKNRRRLTQRQRDEVRGTVELDIVPNPSGPVAESKNTLPNTHYVSTTDIQIGNGLVALLVAIVRHVRTTDDTGEAILALLAPALDEPGREDLVDALETWNEDAVWLVRERRKIELELLEGQRPADDWAWHGVQKPQVGSGLRSFGSLSEVVF